jgi:uncharacterized LabA/DUF88 family protein
MEEKGHYAFIDGQNLHLWTTTHDPSRKIDYKKFRRYLKEKYNITQAIYFLWYMTEDHNMLYTKLQKAGYIVMFKNHTINMKSDKKWNVDTDMVFHIMRTLIDEAEDFNKIILVSGDWDYKNVVDYLVKKWRFAKILFPNKKYASSLYKKLGSEYCDDLLLCKEKLQKES